MIDIISPLIKQFLPFAQERMGFSEPPKLFLRGDNKNAQDPLGKTAYYDPDGKSITVYITGRHPKDVMRSISHELVHHAQCCRGDLDGSKSTEPGYAQNDKHMREMEREAYEVGNMCFRDWEDSLKNTIYLEHLQKGEKKMSTKDWKNKELTTLLSEAWGFKFNSLQEFEEFDGSGEIQAEAEEELDENRTDDDEEERKRARDRAQAAKDRMDARRAQRPAGSRLEEDEEEVVEEAEEDVVEEAEEDVVEEADEDIEEASTRQLGSSKDRVAGRDTSGRRIRKEDLEALVQKAIKEALQKRKG